LGSRRVNSALCAMLKMSIDHLKQLRNELENQRWKIISEEGGNDYDISAVWVVARPDGSNQLHIEFEGLDDLKTFPIEKSFACHVREASDISVYFGKISKSWPKELSDFIDKIKRLRT